MVVQIHFFFTTLIFGSNSSKSLEGREVFRYSVDMVQVVDDANVAMHVTALGKVLLADTARVGLLARVDASVFGECREIGEFAIADLTRVGFFASVDANVTHLTRTLREGLTAQVALVAAQLLVEVTSHVYL